jgi:hypothetical protein
MGARGGISVALYPAKSNSRLKELPMFKKLVLSALVVIATLQAVSAKAAEDKSVLEKVQMKAFLCLVWECPIIFMKETGLMNLIEMYGQRKAVQSLTIARGDARFFADRVILVEPREHSTDLYKRMVIKLEAGDVVSAIGMINDGNGTSHYGDVRMNIEGLKVLDTADMQAQASGIKINGRPLVSKELAAAHAATQNLIYDGVIKAPGNEMSKANNALLLNKMMLDFVKDR